MAANDNGKNPTDVDLFLRWIETVAQNGNGTEIILAYVSRDYVVMGYNCALSLHRLGIKNVGLLTVDEYTTKFYMKRSIPAFNVALLKNGIPEDVRLGNKIVGADFDTSRLINPEWASRWNNPSMHRWSHWMLRHFLGLQVLKHGYGLFQTDVDMVFLSDPYGWLDPEADLEGQMQHWPGKRRLNLGIGHIAATVGGVLHWETTDNLMRYSGENPQSIENLLMMKPLITQVGIEVKKPCKNRFTDAMCFWKVSPMVSYRTWAESLLPMGYDVETNWTYNQANPTPRMIGIHVHATKGDYFDKNGKTFMYTNFCKEHNVWFVPKYDEVIPKAIG